jgi:TATA-binding protein-associated factor Taf7
MDGMQVSEDENPINSTENTETNTEIEQKEVFEVSGIFPPLLKLTLLSFRRRTSRQLVERYYLE